MLNCDIEKYIKDFANDKQERIAWLRLARSANIGPKTMFSLIGTYKNTKDIIQNIHETAKFFKKKVKIIEENLIEEEIYNTKKFGAELLIPSDLAYPKALLLYDDFPLTLTAKGNIALLKKKILAIVGARNASLIGLKFAKQIAKELASREFVIISGLAKGIDAEAHKGALEETQFNTIGVIAGGIDNIYPSENKSLYEEIITNALLLTEQAFGYKPLAQNFPRRNRIIAALAIGILVIEAALGSGSLITAHLALEKGKEIFAVPGHPLDPRNRGSNQLIKQGATLVESSADILHSLDNFAYEVKEYMSDSKPDFYAQITPIEIDLVRKEMLNLLSYNPITSDSLLEKLNCSAIIFSQLLVELELAGVICITQEGISLAY